MRRWMAAPLVFAVAVGLTSMEPRPVAAQDGKPVAETFRTADGVELHGLFHPTALNATSAPVVVFLYPPGPDRDMTKGDWGSLAKELNKAGYHVFQFDWRGHGKSTSIKDKQKFWGNIFLNGQFTNFNGYIRGNPATKPGGPIKNDILYKDLTQPGKYMPAYLNDLAAVRVHLDSKNDNKDVNTSSIYIVGSEEAAGLGLAWLTAEWNRPAVFPNETQRNGAPNYDFIPQSLFGGIKDEAGADFGGAVWLTAKKPASFPDRSVKGWISDPRMAPKIRENNPMLFLYSPKDANGKKQSEFFYHEVLVANPKKGTNLEPLEQTFIKEVKNGVALQGVKLLGQNAALQTEDTIIDYFKAIQKVRAKLASKTRKYDTPYFVETNYFGLTP